MVALFKGIAHPPPRRDGKRNNVADLSAAEISTANMGRRGGTQMLLEHDHANGQVGRVLASWEGPNGELRVQGMIENREAEEAMRNGTMRELSLGTSVHSETDGRILMRTNDELSLCEQAARPGCIVTDIDNQRVGSSHHFSRKGERFEHADLASRITRPLSPYRVATPQLWLTTLPPLPPLRPQRPTLRSMFRS
jgi:hypothetical protein